MSPYVSDLLANRMHELTFRRELHRDRIQRGSLGQTVSVFTYTQVDVLSHNQPWQIFFWIQGWLWKDDSVNEYTAFNKWTPPRSSAKWNLRETSFSDNLRCKTMHFLSHSVSYKYISAGCEEAFKIIQGNFVSHLITLHITTLFCS